MNPHHVHGGAPEGAKDREESFSLMLETQRVQLLYNQNIPGVAALLIYSTSYVYVSWDLVDPRFLFTWYGILILSAVLRLLATFQWRKRKDSVKTVAELRPWLHFIQSMLFVSGMSWGAIGWQFVHSSSHLQQIFTALSIVFMAAGALVCYSASLRAMFFVLFPAMIPWSLALLLSTDSNYQIMGAISGIYLLLAVRVGRTLFQYVDTGLKLNVENSRLTEDLKKQIEIQKESQELLRENEENLRLALESSGAMNWIWNPEKDQLICDGNLHQTFGVGPTGFRGDLTDFLEFVPRADRSRFQDSFKNALKSGKEIDFDQVFILADGSVHELTFRGKAVEGKWVFLRGIAWDITEKKKALRLHHEHEILQASNKAKSRFLANASHEIRTPLTAINGFAESLLERNSLSEELKKEIQYIVRNGKYLGSLVNDLLDLAKMDTGQLFLQTGLMSPNGEIEECLMVMRPLFESKGLTLKVLYESPLPQWMETDSSRFRQVILNLLSNSVKYTTQGECSLRVRFEYVSSEEGRLLIRVSDTGVGISEDLKKYLFEPFSRDSGTYVQKNEGSGLGLALSRNIAYLLGGDLKLVRSEEGYGAEFEFSLQAPTRGPSKVQDLQSSSLEQLGNLKGLNILVVDDSEDLRVLLSRNLLKRGAFVETCENGERALEAVMLHSFDVILMDIKMPVMDGYKTTEILRKRGYRRPIVALTAHASAEDRQLCYQVGCDDYLSKPVDFFHLYDVIKKRASGWESPLSKV